LEKVAEFMLACDPDGVILDKECGIVAPKDKKELSGLFKNVTLKVGRPPCI